MARTRSSRLNFPGVLALLIGIAAFVATKVPIAGYGPVPVALLGIGVGVLAFLLSLMLRWGSGVPVLAILVSIGALGLAEYNNGTVDQVWAKIHPAPPKPAPAVTPPPSPAPAETNGQPGVHSIFDSDRGTLPAPSPSHATTPAPAAPSPAVATPAPTPVPAIPQPAAPTVSQARAKLDAARAAVEQSLAADPAYAQAKADVAAADAKRKAALKVNEPGSPEVLEASNQWLAAQTSLRKLVDAVAAKDANVQAAQREMSEAEAAIRAGKSGK